MKDGRIKPKRSAMRSGRDLLEQWIRRQRMSQGEAADQIGISRVKLNQYLMRTARPSLETAIRIEDTTGIGVRLWLLEDEQAGGSAAVGTNGAIGNGDVQVNHNLGEGPKPG